MFRSTKIIKFHNLKSHGPKALKPASGKPETGPHRSSWLREVVSRLNLDILTGQQVALVKN